MQSEPAPSWRPRLPASAKSAALLLAALLSAAAVPARAGDPALAVPATGAYTGAYVDFGDTEDTVTLAAVQGFEKLAGKHQAIVGSSSYWGRGKFPTANVRLISDYGAVPLLYWSPWDPPYEQGKHADPGAWKLRRIVAGDCDAYLNAWGAAARDFGRPVLVSFGCEPNADWFPWGGLANGADTKTPDGTFAGPDLYKRAYRHAVDRVRAAGARNVQWVFHVNYDSVPDRPWNAMAQYYPGGDYADWIGMSCYGQITPGKDSWDEWSEVMDDAYKRLAAIDPAKPLMLAEWGVGEFDDPGSKARFITDAFAGLTTGKYPRIKAAVFWHERWQNKDESYSNLRVNSSPTALKAYRQGVADPFWLDRPAFR